MFVNSKSTLLEQVKTVLLQFSPYSLVNVNSINNPLEHKDNFSVFTP